MILRLMLALLLPLAGFAAEEDETQAAQKSAERLLYQVINDFLADLRKGAVSKAYFSFTSREFRDRTSLAAFTTFVSRYPPVSRNTHIDYEDTKYYENVAVVTATVGSADQKENRVRFVVRYEDSHWQIVQIEVFAIETPSSPA